MLSSFFFSFLLAAAAVVGPVSTSINDFWRMVWHQRAKTIAMVTNLEERGRVRVGQIPGRVWYTVYVL